MYAKNSLIDADNLTIEAFHLNIDEVKKRKLSKNTKR